MKDLIAKIDFFAGLDDKILKKIGDACIMRQYTKNETIVRQGEMGLGLYLISKGRVRVDREQGGIKMQVAELGAEQFFGEMSLLDNKPRSATCTSLEDAECVLLTRDSFVKLMNKYPEIPIRMARVIAERLRLANEKLAAAPPPQQPASAPGTAAHAGATVAASAPGASANGASAPVAPPDASTKGKIQKTLLDTFSSLYTMKALTRFSVAVIGCPVEGSAANAFDRFQVGEVKVIVLPSDQPSELRIEATEPGEFTLHVFTPHLDEPAAFGPVPIRPERHAICHLDGSAVSLR